MAKAKTLVMSILMLALIGVAWATAGDDAVDPAAFHAAMEGYELSTLDGETLEWNSLRGEVIIVSFWASWCKPCRKEMPELGVMHTEMAKKNGRVVAISIDQDVENARRFAEIYKIELPLYHDGPKGLVKTLDLPHIPYTLVLDRSGEIALTTHGAEDEQLELLATTTRELMATAPQVTAVTEGDK